ncbi:MAG: hypothetical protein IBX70_12130 [Clostridia bacterium]|nr:hypothetical protein [Clostridia bacterium]
MANKIYSIPELGNIKLEGHLINPDAKIDKVKYGVVALGQGGGKLSIEFNRVGHYVSLFNTAQEDLTNAELTLKKIGNTNYKITRFSGFDGAKKDRSIGLKAVHENIEILQNNLVEDENLKKADFIWVAAAFGGGTGSGSVTDVVRIVSNLIRDGHSRIGYEEDENENIISEGKPTVGVIAMIPDDSSGHRVKLNAAEALQELVELQNDGTLGSILLVDNEKLMQEALRNDKSKLKWHEQGNASVLSLITEVTVTSSLPSDESFDKSELLDIFSEPGFLSFSKYSFNTRLKDDLDTIVNSSTESSVFTDGYNLSEAIISALLIIKNKKSTLLNSHDELMIRTKMSEKLSNVRYLHYGIYDVNTTQDYETAIRNIGKHSYQEKEKVIIYSLSILKNPPKRIIEMIESALLKRQQAEASFSESRSKLSDFNLTQKSEVKKKSAKSLQTLLSQKNKKPTNLVTASESTNETFAKNVSSILELKTR